MNIGFTADTFWEAKVDDILYYLIDNMEHEFLDKQYGKNNLGIIICLFCYNNILKINKTGNAVEYYKKKNQIAYNVILDFELMKRGTEVEKRISVANEIINQTKVILDEYNFKDFDKEAFIIDLKLFFVNHKWL